MHARILIAAALAVCFAAASPAATPSPPRGKIVRADDGFDLWYEALGRTGPAVIFISRTPDEHRALAQRLSVACRVVLFEPRHMAVDYSQQIRRTAKEHPEKADRAMLDHFANRNLDWDLAQFKVRPFPAERAIADLHAVADAAGIDTFTISGYSSTSLYAQFLVPLSKRITGIIAGGFPVLGGYEYWQGVYDASAMSLARAGSPVESADYALFSKTVEALRTRDEKAVYRSLPGVKVVFFGSRDGEPGDRLYEAGFKGGRMAAALRKQRKDLEALGFKVIELEGFDHIDLLSQADLIAARLMPLIR